jgi:hypothetical protein
LIKKRRKRRKRRRKKQKQRKRKKKGKKDIKEDSFYVIVVPMRGAGLRQSFRRPASYSHTLGRKNERNDIGNFNV